ncbi:MAG: hypothetical protein ACLFTX_04130 [Thiohalospira sp.]
MAVIYRAVAGASNGDIKYPHPESRRLPKNIPYVVDNLWEWSRPAGYADRRQCAYGSRSPEEARQSGKGEVYALEFLGDHQLCQLRGYADAKCHPDVHAVKDAAFNALGGYDWSNRTLAEKSLAGGLYIPGLTAEEVETVLTEAGLTEADMESLRAAVGFWGDVTLVEPGEALPDPKGEIFFTYPDGYVLRALDSA